LFPFAVFKDHSAANPKQSGKPLVFSDVKRELPVKKNKQSGPKELTQRNF